MTSSMPRPGAVRAAEVKAEARAARAGGGKGAEPSFGGKGKLNEMREAVKASRGGPAAPLARCIT